MQRVLLTLIFSAGLSLNAATELKEDMNTMMPKSDGIQVALSKSFLDVEITESSIPIETESSSLNDVMGLSIGYINAPIRSLGYMGTLQIDQVSEDGETLNVYSLYADGVYALSTKANLFAGLNISKIEESGESDSAEISPSLGIQLGGEYRFTNNFSLRGRYIIRNNELTFPGLSSGDLTMNARISGLELALVGTF
ncbi:MAG: porin family protein [Bdellovibrionales bacterium]|nr:porin family protein [Bdellovibrionales bacterium]